MPNRPRCVPAVRSMAMGLSCVRKGGDVAMRNPGNPAGLTRRRHVDLVRVSSALCPYRG
ncbi:putative leader peptide [Streptomyces sp. LN699]|uniref:putative leader peptide n=1 Tax=Streptomyces sp. LN699 TaxID=3112981 RepID=UPI003721045B